MRAYHGVLEQLKIKPQRSLADDMQLQSGVMSYGGSSPVSVPAGIPRNQAAARPVRRAGRRRRQARLRLRWPENDPSVIATTSALEQRGYQPIGQPDFARMSAAEKLAYNKAKRDRIFG